MHPSAVGRPAGLYPHYVPPHHFTYQSTVNPRVQAYHHPPQPSYMHSIPHAYPQAMHPMPAQGYLPQYHPMHFQSPPIAQHMPPYYPQYVPPVQPNPYMSRSHA